MIDPSFFLRQTQASGIELFTGVPCSLFTSLIDTVIADSKNGRYGKVPSTYFATYYQQLGI